MKGRVSPFKRNALFTEPSPMDMHGTIIVMHTELSKNVKVNYSTKNVNSKAFRVIEDIYGKQEKWRCNNKRFTTLMTRIRYHIRWICCSPSVSSTDIGSTEVYM